jgi:hypothetical protein
MIKIQDGGIDFPHCCSARYGGVLYPVFLFNERAIYLPIIYNAVVPAGVLGITRA